MLLAFGALTPPFPPPIASPVQALVGCHSVEGTSELLTADTSGLFKLWDLRNFQCIQTAADGACPIIAAMFAADAGSGDFFMPSQVTRPAPAFGAPLPVFRPPVYAHCRPGSALSPA